MGDTSSWSEMLKGLMLLWGLGTVVAAILPIADAMLLRGRLMPKIYRAFWATHPLCFLLPKEVRHEQDRAVSCGRRLYSWNLAILIIVELLLIGLYIVAVPAGDSGRS